MAKETPVINILTYHLPFELTNQIYNEFQSRFKEANFLIENYKTYSSLQVDNKTVELLLALSVFHKRVIANLDGAVKFYGTVTKSSEAEIIKIGSYDLTNEEKNKILAVVMSYNKLLEEYSIPPIVMEYYETREFLRKLIDLKSVQNNVKKRKKGNDNEDEIPF
ncbi:hypothetical protein IP98_00332 [Flavobacterium cauense R2A-7]|uniref:Uncharacterized protein n=1 Tax=Flavobacterium cauense R2A-7 TaxID=1341154 RepID=A0A562M653_9FLAO|nr:hypothetical protein [Flavobacterium cauense]KGO82371.1 hypothetical protein Q762_06765 [Flavobacterium cauense R2A-7]TWI15340.1 hypothetical protein IP98_00332 [Flavobacterium cauense R2A-7]